MFRIGLVVSVGLWSAAVAGAQGERPIQWISNAEQGVARAKSSGLPVLFYVSGTRREAEDLKDAQQRAFRDPMVRGIAQERFVPVRLPLSSTTKQILAQMGAPQQLGYCLVCATPNGELIGVIPAGQVAEAGALARQLTTLFRKYRQNVFESELKPTLEDSSARAGDIIKALKVIEKLLILEADESVAKLLERGGLSKTVQKQVYSTLAELSTPRSVKALFEAALKDKLAARSLARCTPAGAEELLDKLDLANRNEFLVVYEAVTKICKIRDTKPKGFWNGDNQRLLTAEIERVKTEVRSDAKRWREKYEAYR